MGFRVWGVGAEGLETVGVFGYGVQGFVRFRCLEFLGFWGLYHILGDGMGFCMHACESYERRVFPYKYFSVARLRTRC